jgi:hypothetical protein
MRSDRPAVATGAPVPLPRASSVALALARAHRYDGGQRVALGGLVKDQRQRVRDELAELQSAGEGLAERVVSEDLDPRSVNAEYQAWYSLASRVVKQVLPDRAAEFDEYYRCTRKREGWHLTISDILSDTRKPRSDEQFGRQDGGE